MRSPIEIVLMTSVVVGSAVLGCSAEGRGSGHEDDDREGPAATAPVVPDEDVKTVVDGNSQFALDLYQYLRTEEGNLFFSPHSISTALGMTYIGARNATEWEMENAMRFGLPQESLHPAFGALAWELGTASGEDAPIDLHIANRLWGHDSGSFLPSFIDTVSTHYAGGFESVDFCDKEAARKRINVWIADQTRDKIPELLKPEHMKGDVKLVLTNAIYFKGNWARQFKTSLTRDAPFFTSPESSIKTAMMHQTEQFPLYQSDLLQAIELPYEGDRLSMIIFLPRARDSLGAVEEALTMENIKAWMGRLRAQKVQVTMPKFKMRFAKELTKALRWLGMPSAFNESADFSGFTGRRDLLITAVAHEAYVDVNEEGTEAAAATGVVVGRTSVAPPPPSFVADHPFIFVIRDRKTGAILFMGRVADPTEGTSKAE